MLMEQIDNSGSAELKELEDVGNKMPATLTKLFGRDHQTIITGAAAKVAKKEKFHRYEVYCREKGTTDIHTSRQCKSFSSKSCD